MFGIPGRHILNIIGDYPNACASLIEESGELISALAKHENNPFDDFSMYKKHIIEEMTHVLVSMNMVCVLLDISEEDIKKEVKRKAIIDGFNISNYEW